MFRMVASSSPKPRWSGGAAASFTVHALVIGAAVAASAAPPPPRDRPVERTITFHDHTRPPAPVPETPPATTPLGVAAPPLGAPVLPPLIDVPSGLPDVDVTRGLTRPEDWAGSAGVRGGSSTGQGDGPVVGDRPWAAWQVEQPAMALPGSPTPRYPDLLRAAGVEGEAVMAFVVDTTGRVDPASITVLRTTHELFAAAVRQALPTMRFVPAEVDGRKVRQLVQQPFVFAVRP